MRGMALGLVMAAGVAWAQAGVVSTGTPQEAATAQQGGSGADEMTAEQMAERAKGMMAEALRSPAGLSSVTLEKYPRHFTMLTVRTKSGGGEMHGKYADIFVVLDGEAVEVTGGHLVDAKEGANGETRGLKVEGGVSHPLHKGDVIHIAPGTPHQTMVPEGKTFTYFVVKVEE